MAQGGKADAFAFQSVRAAHEGLDSSGLVRQMKADWTNGYGFWLTQHRCGVVDETVGMAAISEAQDGDFNGGSSFHGGWQGGAHAHSI